jgi:hypothetical protein
MANAGVSAIQTSTASIVRSIFLSNYFRSLFVVEVLSWPEVMSIRDGEGVTRMAFPRWPGVAPDRSGYEEVVARICTLRSLTVDDRELVEGFLTLLQRRTMSRSRK